MHQELKKLGFEAFIEKNASYYHSNRISQKGSRVDRKGKNA